MKLDNRFVRFGTPGMADILAFPRQSRQSEHWPTWIECKAERGVQSELQKSFQEQVEREGHRYVIARSVDDVEAALGAART